jgi:4-hydroxy-tetrahydrodipicolinate synthase
MISPGRILTAMVTPFSRDGAVDYAQARRLAAALVASCSDGLVITGTTGEAPTLSSAEKLRLYAEVKDELGDAAAVIAGASDNCTEDSIALCREAARTGVDALLLSTPYYNKPTQEGLYRHFAAICDAVDLPCIAYNIPSRTALNITAETTLRLAGIRNMTGIKESSADLRQIARIIEGAPPRFRVWTGDDADTFHVLCLGGYGVVSVATHLVGRQIATMTAAVLEGRLEEAAALHRRLLPLIDALFCVTNPIPVKYALNHLGFDVGGFRLPLCEPDEASAARIRAELARHTIDLPLPV